MRKKTPVTRTITKLIAEGASFHDLLVHEDISICSYMLQRGKQVKWFIDARNTAQNESELMEYPFEFVQQQAQPPADSSLFILQRAEVFKWLRDNLFDRHLKRRKRRHKQKQLWITAFPDLGKSTLVMWLQLFCNTFIAPMVENHYEDYVSGTYDLVVFDEFNGGHIKCTWLNRFLEGQKYRLVGRHVSPMKADNPPVIILSNLAPDEAYSGAHAAVVAALKTRVTHVEFEEHQLLQFVQGGNYLLPTLAPHIEKIIE